MCYRSRDAGISDWRRGGHLAGQNDHETENHKDECERSAMTERTALMDVGVQRLGRMPSEKKWGIAPQPDATCPLIDDALDDLRRALKELDGWDKCEDVGELRHKCDMGAWYADRLNVTLEEIRKSAGEIRDWGDAWKTLAKDQLEQP